MDEQFYLHAFGAMVTRREREFLRQMASEACVRFSHPTIVNVGVFAGCSLHCLTAGASTARIIGVDVKYDSPNVERRDLLTNCEFVESDSAEYGRQFRDEVHLLFVDGDHHYEQVKKDIAAWCPHVVAGGTVVFHDYAPADVDLRRDPSLVGVKRAVDEWRCTPGGRCYAAVDAPDSMRAFTKRKC